ncbi:MULTISPECIES: HYC_CC_PP family protein [Rhodonellum]|nr:MULTISPECIES: hypothetical protein [Rhodonellum]SDZ00422.1 hypothetical protein SAMN05444412_104265 [Rhodonellum ikkaensis]
MKQFIKIALLLLFVFFNAGLSYSMHYCGEDFQLINLYAESKTCCPSEEPMPGCCDDVSNLDLPNTDQQQIDLLDFQTLPIASIVPEFFEFQIPTSIKEKVLGFSNSSPPYLHKTPIYISIQVFLI